MMGAFWSGGWGWGRGWGGNNVYINNNNNFNRNVNGGNRNNIGGGNRGNLGGARPSNPIAGGGGRDNLGGGGRGDLEGGNRASTLPAGGGGAGDRWQHNPAHRGAPYRERATTDRFGGTARGDSLSNRQASARQQLGRQGGNLASNRASGGGLGARGGGSLGNRNGGNGPDRIGSRDLSRTGGGQPGCVWWRISWVQRIQRACRQWPWFCQYGISRWRLRWRWGSRRRSSEVADADVRRIGARK
jgi:hypothetical protein